MIPELNREDADIVLTLVAKRGVMYDTPVTDPMFSTSNKSVIRYTTTLGERPVYQADPIASVVGCAQQVCYHLNFFFPPAYSSSYIHPVRILCQGRQLIYRSLFGSSEFTGQHYACKIPRSNRHPDSSIGFVKYCGVDVRPK